MTIHYDKWLMTITNTNDIITSTQWITNTGTGTTEWLQSNVAAGIPGNYEVCQLQKWSAGVFIMLRCLFGLIYVK